MAILKKAKKIRLGAAPASPL